MLGANRLCNDADGGKGRGKSLEKHVGNTVFQAKTKGSYAMFIRCVYNGFRLEIDLHAYIRVKPYGIGYRLLKTWKLIMPTAGIYEGDTIFQIIATNKIYPMAVFISCMYHVFLLYDTFDLYVLV